MFQKSNSLTKNIKPKMVFVSYSHKDESLKDLLMLTLRSLEVEGYIRTWHDRMIIAGQKWDKTIKQHIEATELFLFLVSDSFLQSGYCRRIELKTALKKAKEKRAHVIPLILLECDWKKEQIAKFLALPIDGQPLFKANGAPYPLRLQQTVDGLRLALLGLWNYSNDEENFGAVVSTLSEPTYATYIVEPNTTMKLLEPSKPFIPLLLKGLKLSEDTLELNFLIDSGHTGFAIQSLEWEKERRRVMDYFWESLGVEGDQQWVNLSPYDSSRMLPEVLSGTRLGRDMLEFDCKLKEFSASLLHPDTDTGHIYWQELYKRAKTEFGTTMLPFQTFHTITVSASKAKVFEPPKSYVPEVTNQPMTDFLSKPYSKAGIVVGYKLQAVCNPDKNAETYNNTASNKYYQRVPAYLINNLSTEVFRETMVPIIENEINEGEIFAFNRQLFLSMILAHWLKEVVKQEKLVGNQLTSYIDKNRPDPLKFSSVNITQLTNSGPGIRYNISHQTPSEINYNDPAFRIPENKLFYQRYIKLFKRGLYHIARTEDGDTTGQKIGRVYFSGAIDFSSIPISITTYYGNKNFCG